MSTLGMENGGDMRRRTIIGTGLAGLALSLLPQVANADRSAARLAARLSAARRAAGLPDLVNHHALSETARLQTLHMCREKRTTHIDGFGREPVARARDAGYSGRLLGETLAETYDGPVATADLWLAHERTRNVLMNPSAEHFGIHCKQEQTGLAWWDVVVGCPT